MKFDIASTHLLTYIPNTNKMVDIKISARDAFL